MVVTKYEGKTDLMLRGPETKATIARFKKAFSEAPLWAFDAGNGKKTFERSCAICHPLNGVGGKIGPDLAGSWRNGVDYFIENIVASERNVAHRLIEEFMLLANETVAAHLEKTGMPALYRIHEAPKDSRPIKSIYESYFPLIVPPTLVEW